jgi:Domain of unknown function (DUF4192)
LTTSDKPPIRVGSAESMLAVIPGLLGFHPASSVVIVGAGPRGRVEVTFRYDLPDPPDLAAAARIAAATTAGLLRHDLTLAVVAGYGPGPAVTPVTDTLATHLRDAGIRVHDMLRVEGGRYWSYLCRDPGCCPPEGVPFDPASHPAAQALTEAGNPALAGRAELAASLAPLAGPAAETASVVHRLAALPPAPTWLAASVQESVTIYRNGGQLTTAAAFARILVAVADLRVRDDTWARMDPDPEHIAAQLRLWTDVVRRAPAAYVPAAASLLAITAWMSGNGALANAAAQRALAADPGYSLALIVLEAISAGAPPSAAQLPMTPEEVASSYAKGCLAG